MKKQNDEVKAVVSVRMTPTIKSLIKMEFGSVQSFVDYHVKELQDWIKRKDFLKKKEG